MLQKIFAVFLAVFLTACNTLNRNDGSLPPQRLGLSDDIVRGLSMGVESGWKSWIGQGVRLSIADITANSKDGPVSMQLPEGRYAVRWETSRVSGQLPCLAEIRETDGRRTRPDFIWSGRFPEKGEKVLQFSNDQIVWIGCGEGREKFEVYAAILVKVIKAPAPAQKPEAKPAPKPEAPTTREPPAPKPEAKPALKQEAKPAPEPRIEVSWDCENWTKAVLSLWCGNLLKDGTVNLPQSFADGGVPFYLKRVNMSFKEFFQAIADADNAKLYAGALDEYANELRKNGFEIPNFKVGGGRDALKKFFSENRFAEVACTPSLLKGHYMSFNSTDGKMFGYYKRTTCGPGEKILVLCKKTVRKVEQPAPKPEAKPAPAPKPLVMDDPCVKYGIPRGQKRLVVDVYNIDELPSGSKEAILKVQAGRVVDYEGRSCEGGGNGSVSRCFGAALHEGRSGKRIAAVPDVPVTVQFNVTGGVEGREVRGEQSHSNLIVRGGSGTRDFGPEVYGTDLRMKVTVPEGSGWKVLIPLNNDYVLFGGSKTEWGQCSVGVAILLERTAPVVAPAPGPKPTGITAEAKETKI